MASPKKIGLALGGGGAKGLAHIGVIKTLLDAGISIDYIAGTSMGALVGGWYAATKDIDSLEDIFLKIRSRDVSGTPRLLKKKDGEIFRDDSIAELLESRLRNRKIEGCEIPFSAVATDIKNGDEVIFAQGGLVEAIRASIAIPIIFKPVESGDLALMDGGFSNPVPADVVRKMGAEFVIAVDVSTKWLDFSSPDVNIRKFHSIYTIVEGALSVIQYQIAKGVLKQADIVLRPLVLSFRWLEFDRAYEIIERGARETRSRLKDIRKGAGYPEPPRTPAQKFWDFIFSGFDF